MQIAKHKRLLAIVGLLVAVGAVGGRMIYKEVRWKRFAVVEPGKVYRSGQLSERQFERAAAKLRLSTVICLNEEKREFEKQFCEKSGIQFRSFSMPSSGLGSPEDFLEILDILRDPDSRPVLIHCSAGVARTGTAIALYRMAQEGWSAEEAIAELRSFERRGHIEPDLRAHILTIEAKHLKRDATASKNESSIH